MTVDSDSHDISSPNSSLGVGFEIVLGLGLGTGLALGLRVGWVLCPKLIELNSLWQRIRKVKQNHAENHSFFPEICPLWREI